MSEDISETSHSFDEDGHYVSATRDDTTWWKGAAIYQVYPRSFKDSNGDGVGDLQGVIEHLDHIASLGVDGIWLSPFFTSPMADFGYDIADFCDVDPVFGALSDFDQLIDKAHELGLKVIIDQIYSHSSDKHPWFEESRLSRTNSKADWYVWADANEDGTPPNNWQSVFGMGAWQWDARRGQYYLHNFLVEQPDLNLHNPDVQTAILGVTKFWLDRGVDGFRLDALNFGMHDPELKDNPVETVFKRPPTRPFDFQRHVNSMSHPDIPKFLESIRRVIDGYPGRFTVAEVGGPFPMDEMKAFTQGDKRLNSAYAFDFLYAPALSAELIRNTLSEWPGEPNEGWPSWAFSNHDAPRAVSRWRGSCDTERYAKLLAAVLASFRGNIFIYQGEELGLPQANVAFEDLKDPEAITNWPETLGRDGARTPMPWTQANRCAGFSTEKPWLPVDDRHLEMTVAKQNDTQDSVLNFYRQIIACRNNSSALRIGEIKFLDSTPELLVLQRTHEGETRICAFNLTDTDHSLPEGLEFSAEICVGEAVTNGQLPAYSGVISQPL
ncbi:alpha-amylase family glycosyl hydrolase [Litorimonas sp. RW-G-Af-16]|uniref:alpha-amylase family glycosyl hydrolase n=1 Tax=Litorimonas sp. RW-G-Af-16 TaxID=3241168 RepID=UPI00390C7F5E